MIPRYHPQIRIRDILRALVPGSSACPSVSQLLRDKPQDERNLFWLDSGTSSLVVALRALNLPKNSGVAVPVYSCVTVFEAIAAAELKCVFIDLDPQTLMYDGDSLEKHKDKFQAVIIIHLFGFAADIAKLKRIVGSKPIIEDCSHAFGSADSLGNPVGLTGTASVFSFNTHKPVSAGGGGLLVINDKAYLEQVTEIIASVPYAKCNVLKLTNLIVKVVCFHPMIYTLLIKLGIIKLRRLGSLGERVNIKRISNVHLKLIRSRLNGIDRRRIKQWTHIQTMLKVPVKTPVTNLGHSFWNAYLFPLLIPDISNRERLMDYFNREGIDVFELWPEFITTASRFGYNNECGNTEKFVRQLLFIPCYAELTSTQLKRITKALSEAQNLGWL